MNIFSIIMCLSMIVLFSLFIYMVVTQKVNRKYNMIMWICNIIYWTAMAIKHIV